MASKKAIISTLTDIKNNLIKDIDYVNRLEMGTFYKFTLNNGEEIYGYVIYFNKESIRVQIVASNMARFSGSRPANFFKYHEDRVTLYLGMDFTIVKETDLPLLVGMTFVHDALYKDIINGKKKLKMDK